ncbi:SDR family oxidoreductase [Oscillatoria amoena NRMC-F 0135]|nr:SDR family oxidoreductase [Oscillatoria amoena NRMC-F 0135]
MSNPFSLEGETALITGGGTGLGFGIARAMVDAGARVVIVGRRAELLRDAAGQLGEQASYRAHDICDFDTNERLIADLATDGLSPSILVNNAGVHLRKRTVDLKVDEFRKLMDTHVFAAHSLSAACLKLMIPQRRGSILYIASMTSFIGQPLVVAYSAAKSAYLGIVRTISADHAADGIRCNAIAPGWIASPMLEQALAGDDARRQKIISRTPMKRFGDPQDIGLAAVYLCSPAARFVTGIVLPIDGGASTGF